LGFYALPHKNKKVDTKGLSIELLHKMGCKACPLDKIRGNVNPHLAPQGSSKPLVYMLDGPPSIKDDKLGKNFSGGVSRLIMRAMPESMRERTRWSSVTRTASREVDTKKEKDIAKKREETKQRDKNAYLPPREAKPIEIACCRPSIEKDIAETKPVAIFAFGNEALHWLIGQRGIDKWRGRRFPVTLGGHTCWVYPMLHPEYSRSKRKWQDRDAEEEYVLTWDIQKACRAIERGQPEPIVHDRKHIADDVDIITGDEEHALEKVLSFIRRMGDEKEVGFDYETNKLRPYNDDARILSVAMSSASETMGFALDHPKAGWSSQQLDEIFDALKDFLLTAPTRKVVHQLAFELEWSGVVLGRKTIRAQAWLDTVAQAYVLDERMKMGRPDALSLEFLCLQYFGFNLKDVSNLDRKNLIEAPIKEMLTYNGLDAKYHRLLCVEQRARLINEKLVGVFQHHNQRVPTTVLTQMKGVPIHQPTVRKFYKRFKAEEEKAYDKIVAMKCVKTFEQRRKIEFEPSNGHHVRWLLKNVIGVDLRAVTGKGGKESADKKLLDTMQHPFARALETYRSAAKNLVTYILPARKGSPHIYDDGMMHPILSTSQTRTGRTSSEDPNVQNWPKRKLKEVRSQVRGDETKVIVSFDYGQIQARNIGMESLDPAFVKSFWSRHDIHADWTNNIAKKCPMWHRASGLKDKQGFSDARGDVKNAFVFPSFFGASPKSISGNLGLKDYVTRVQALQDELFDQFPGIKTWQDGLKDFYRTNGYVTGHSGYRRRAPVTPNELINAPIQADEAMIVMDAMSRLSRKGWNFQANMEIHDDLTFVWKRKDVNKFAEIVVNEMIHVPFKWAQTVPISVEMSIGEDWGTLKEVAKYSSDQWTGYEPHSGSWSDGEGWVGMEKYTDGKKRSEAA
jgi:DNA polymerase I-like protein with 3'-5' exonuclease and polymerase domains/uracil-DNA glycosylase